MTHEPQSVTMEATAGEAKGARKRGHTMSRRNSPQFHLNRKILLQGNPPCHWCGKPNATDADHIIPFDAGGSDDLDNLVPACKQCNSKRGAQYVNQKRAIQQLKRNEALNAKKPQNAENVFLIENTLPPTLSFSLSEKQTSSSVISSEQSESLWSSRHLPRLSTSVVGEGSWGPDVAAWAERVMGKTLMGWQVEALNGMLTYRVGADGFPELVCRESLVSTARQNGKSVALTALIGWALTEWPLIRGMPVKVLSTANKLDRAVAIFNDLAPYLESHFDAKVTWSYGRNKVEIGDNLWEVRAAVPSLHGMSPTLIVVDELWDISEDVYFNALRPSQIAQRSPLLSNWSTAGDQSSVPMQRLRDQALAAIDTGRQTKLHFAEWSMPTGANPEDRSLWVMANPALGTMITMDALEAAAESPDRAAFLRAHLNVWVAAANGWLPPGLWDKCVGQPYVAEGGTLALESSVDDSRYVGVRARKNEQGQIIVNTEFVAESIDAMWAKVLEITRADLKVKLAVSAGLDLQTPYHLQARRTVVGYGELLKYTSIVRNMINEGLLIHTGEQLLGEHVNRAVMVKAQSSIVVSSQKSPGPIEACRAMIWAAALTSKPGHTKKATMGFSAR